MNSEVLGARPPPKISRVIFDKMQGGPTHFMAESHCAAKSWKNFSLSKEQGEASGIAGKSGETAGCKEAGRRDHGTNGHGRAQSPRRDRSVRRETGLRQSSNGQALGGDPARPIACDGMVAAPPRRAASGSALRRLGDKMIVSTVADLNTKAARGLDRNCCQPRNRRPDRTATGPHRQNRARFICALGHKACRDDRSVLYYRVPRLLPGWHGVKPCLA
jgi:hypothetical protein